MSFKCNPQVLGLVRADGTRRDGQGKSKHRANVGAIVSEAFLIADPNNGHPIPYRKSASETYERELTKYNIYTGHATADAVLAAIEEAAATQTVDVKVEDKKTHETVIRHRALRSDAVIAMAVIFNPPGSVACHWTQEQNEKFFEDSLDVMGLIQCSIRVDKEGNKKKDQKRSQQECHLFRRENIVATAEHRDEGEPEESEGIRTPNWHVIYKPEGEDGKYKGNLIDPFFLTHLSEEYPRLMRERGWDIEDCDTTKWSKFYDESDPKNVEYKAQRKAKIKEGGKSVNRYRARANRKKAAAQVKEAQDILDRVIETKQDVDEYAERTRQEADKKADEARQEKEQAEKKREEAEQAANKALEKKQLTEMGIQLLDDLRIRRQEEIQELEEQRQKDIEDAGKARQELGSVRTELGQAVSERDAARQEADKLRSTMVEQAEKAAVQASQEMKNRIVANAKKSMVDWRKKQAEETNSEVDRIIAAAKAKAAEIQEAATGEYAFLLEWLNDPAMAYKSGPFAGKTVLEVARMSYKAKIRNERVTQMPSSVRDAAKRQQAETERTTPGE